MILSVVFGLITTIVTALIVVAVNSFFSFDLSSFSLFFIIPVGGIAIGLFSCLGYYLGLLKNNKKVSSGLKWLGVLLALLCFVGIQYGFYYTAYLDDDMELNYKMEGDHVSEFYIEDTGESLTFLNFTVEIINSRSMSFSYRSSNLLDVDGNKTVNWIFFGLDVIGILLGALAAKGMVLGSKKYCDSCSRYMKQKQLTKFSASDEETLQMYKNIVTLAPQDLMSLTNKAIAQGEAHYDVSMDWCETCNTGYLQLKYMVPEAKGKFKHIPAKSIELSINANIVRAIA